MNSSKLLLQNVKLGSIFFQFPKELAKLIAKFERLFDLVVSGFIPNDSRVEFCITRAPLSRVGHLNVISQVFTHGCAVRLDHLQRPDRRSAEVVRSLGKRVAFNERLKLAHDIKKFLRHVSVPSPFRVSGCGILRVVKDDFSEINLKFSHSSQRWPQTPVDTAKFTSHCKRQRLLVSYSLFPFGEDHLSNGYERCGDSQNTSDKRLIVIEKVAVSIGRCEEVNCRQAYSQQNQRRRLGPPPHEKLTQISPLIISAAAIYQNNQKVSNAA